MTIKLNSHILERLGLQTNCTEDELQGKLDGVAVGSFNIFHSEASKSEILNIASNGCEDKVEILNPMYRIERWCYHKITNDTKEIAEVVHIPQYSSDGTQAELSIPPTEAEKLLVRAWHLEKEVIEGVSADQDQLIDNKIIVLWRKGGYETFPEGSKKALYALLHASVSEISSVCNEKWWEAWQQITNFNLSNECCLIDNKDKTALVLFKAAFGEIVIRWRFLSLYRILERGYLRSILQNINQEFMKSPKSTVNYASQRLDDEYSQFVGLVKAHQMDSFFEDFANCIESLSDSMNRYVIMLKREISENRLNKNTKVENGVLQCYKVRCSIVHAGVGALVIDEFSDADDALRSLVVPLENAVIKYVGITTI